MELALATWAQETWPLPEQYRRFGLGRVWAQESCQTDQCSYHPGPDMRLWAGPPQYLLHLWAAGTCEEADPTETKQDLHDLGQQQDFQEESKWGYSIDDVAEARSFKSDQRFFNEHLQVELLGQKRILCDTSWHTTAFTVRFYFILFFKFSASIRMFWNIAGLKCHKSRSANS